MKFASVKRIRSEIPVEKIVALVAVPNVVTSSDYTQYAGAIFVAPVPLAGRSAARQFVLAFLALALQAHLSYVNSRWVAVVTLFCVMVIFNRCLNCEAF